MDLTKIGREDLDYIDLPENRANWRALVNTVTQVIKGMELVVRLNDYQLVKSLCSESVKLKTEIAQRSLVELLSNFSRTNSYGIQVTVYLWPSVN
jgi:hypothetical protein